MELTTALKALADDNRLLILRLLAAGTTVSALWPVSWASHRPRFLST